MDTKYNLSYALAHPDSQQYLKLLSDMDTIAEELAKLAEAKVPVLWRPLHEAWGGWYVTF